MKRSRNLLLVLLVAGVTSVFFPADASPVYQGSGNFLAFEAEVGVIDNSGGLPDAGFLLVDPASVLADGILEGTSEDFFVLATEGDYAPGSGLLSFSLVFAKPGNYRVFVRAAFSNDAYPFDNPNTAPSSSDSAYYAMGFGNAPVFQPMNAIDQVSGGLVASGPISDSSWEWFQVGTRRNVNEFTPLILAVSQVQEELVWAISSREDGLAIDRVVFVHEDELTGPQDLVDGALDNVLNSGSGAPAFRGTTIEVSEVAEPESVSGI